MTVLVLFALYISFFLCVGHIEVADIALYVQ